MADLTWRCSSSFSNNNQSHHDVITIVKDYQCASQLHDFFRHFSILAFLDLWLNEGENGELCVCF